MKLLFVHEHFGALAGAEANIQLTARELKRRGHTIGLLHSRNTGKEEAAWQETFSYRHSLSANDGANQVRRTLEEFQPDLTYVHKMPDLEVIEALIDSGSPTVRMIHDHDIYCMRSYKYHYFSRNICKRPVTPYCLFPCLGFVGRNPRHRFAIRWVSYQSKKKEIRLNQRFHRVVVYSFYTKDELLRNGFAADKIETHVAVRSHAGERRHSSFDDRNLILYIGQIVRGKGVDVLLRALAKVASPFECIIVGDGNHRRYCESLSRKLGLNGRVRFKGFVPPAELEKYYLDCSVFVISSVWPEPFALVGPEAMHYGLPIVAFNVGGISEWLIHGHNGFLVPWMDESGFAACIQELLSDKTRARQMGENGFQLVTQRYDLSKHITGLENMFARVIDEVQHNRNYHDQALAA